MAGYHRKIQASDVPRIVELRDKYGLSFTQISKRFGCKKGAAAYHYKKAKGAV